MNYTYKYLKVNILFVVFIRRVSSISVFMLLNIQFKLRKFTRKWKVFSFIAKIKNKKIDTFHLG